MFRDRTNPLDYLLDEQVLGRFRVTREIIFDISDLLTDDISPSTGRSNSIPATHQVLCALRYYGTGSLQKVGADLFGLSQPSVSRIVDRVSRALSSKARNFIRFPKTYEEQRPMIGEFYDNYRFPNTVGCVDGSLVPIRTPTVDEHLYVCRKGYHAINVQGVCDHRQKFTNIVAQWPGSTHDAFMWGNSSLQVEFAEGRIQGHLLGDSGYPLRPWLLTPIRHPANVAEERYNRRHRRTRQIIERTFGLWKMRWLCLHPYGGVLMFAPERCVNVIIATAVLHNICQERRVPMPEDEDVAEVPIVIVDDGVDDQQDQRQQQPDLEDGRRARQQVIDGHFNR